jgi:excisionase family DNA binding protein
MTTISSFLSKPSGVSEGTLTKKNPEPPPALAYRINDFAKAVGIGRTTIYKLIAEGKIRPIKIAGRVLIPAAEIARLLREAGRPNDSAPNAEPGPARQRGKPGRSHSQRDLSILSVLGARQRLRPSPRPVDEVGNEWLGGPTAAA